MTSTRGSSTGLPAGGSQPISSVTYTVVGTKLDDGGEDLTAWSPNTLFDFPNVHSAASLVKPGMLFQHGLKCAAPRFATSTSPVQNAEQEGPTKYSNRGFHQWGLPQNGWFVRENPIKIDDLGVPLF